MLTCIVCPTGCQIEVVINDGDLWISGYKCVRGKAYAQSECTHPVRTLTTTVRVDNGEIKLLPVKTKTPVDKHLLMDIMEILNQTRVEAPVSIGQIIIENVLGTGVDIIAGRPVKRI